MPTAQVMMERLNSHFTRERVRELSAELFAPGADLARLALEGKIARTDWERGVIAAVPAGMQEMLRALIRHNLQRKRPLSITWAWAPGYDYELNVWECPGTAVSPGGITVLLRTRYPLDAHPSTLGIKRGQSTLAGRRRAAALSGRTRR
jgi:hypothetical protein